LFRDAGRLGEMPRVYLDTNVFDHIDKGLIADAEVLSAQAAFACGKMRGYVSLSTLEELLGPWEGDRARAVRQLHLARNLVGFERILKPQNELLDDVVRAYAMRQPSPSLFLPPSKCVFLAEALSRAAAGELDAEIADVLARVRSLKDKFRDSMRLRGRTFADEIVASNMSGEREPHFMDVWRTSATKLAEGFAERAGVLSECRSRGLPGLLDLRPLRLAVGAALSLFCRMAAGREPKGSDGYDLWHVTVASAADVFVTRDERLAKLLAPVVLLVPGFGVVTSLRDAMSIDGEQLHQRAEE
jgi:hypothetical protein